MPNNSSANVQAIQTLEDLRASLLRFQNEAQSAVTNTQPEITAALDMLQEGVRRWQRELRVRQEKLAQARSALARCEENCGGLAEAVRQAEQRVQEAEQALRTMQYHLKRVGEANESFQREAQRFKSVLTSNELPKASRLLKESINMLQSYISIRPSSGGLSVGANAAQSIASVSSSPLGSATSHPVADNVASVRQLIFSPLSGELLKKAATVGAGVLLLAHTVLSPQDHNIDSIPLPDQAAAATSQSPAEEVGKVFGGLVEGLEEVAEDLKKRLEREAEAGD